MTGGCSFSIKITTTSTKRENREPFAAEDNPHGSPGSRAKQSRAGAGAGGSTSLATQESSSCRTVSEALPAFPRSRSGRKRAQSPRAVQPAQTPRTPRTKWPPPFCNHHASLDRGCRGDSSEDALAGNPLGLGGAAASFPTSSPEVVYSSRRSRAENRSAVTDSSPRKPRSVNRFVLEQHLQRPPAQPFGTAQDSRCSPGSSPPAVPVSDPRASRAARSRQSR